MENRGTVQVDVAVRGKDGLLYLPGDDELLELVRQVKAERRERAQGMTGLLLGGVPSMSPCLIDSLFGAEIS